jgi:hypothetical protein
VRSATAWSAPRLPLATARGKQPSRHGCIARPSGSGTIRCRVAATQVGKTWLLWRIDFLATYTGKHDRRALAQATRDDRAQRLHLLVAQPDPDAPDTLGWRAWTWDEALQRLPDPRNGLARRGTARRKLG